MASTVCLTRPALPLLSAPHVSNESDELRQLRADNDRLLGVIGAHIEECWLGERDETVKGYMTSPYSPDVPALTPAEWSHVHAVMLRQRAEFAAEFAAAK